MFDIGFSEMLLCAVIALLVLGPERLPRAARTAGRWVGKARRFVQQMSEEFDRQVQAEDLREKIKKEGDSLGIGEVQQSVREALSDVRDFNPVILPPDAEAKPRIEPESPVPAQEPRAQAQVEAASEAPEASAETSKH